MENGSTPRVSYIVGRLNRALELVIGERVAEYGVTLPQYVALSVLQLNDRLSNAQLARRTFVRPQSMMQVTQELERRGLIVREPDEENRRILRAGITPEGRSVLAACDRLVSEMEDDMLADVSAQEQVQLRKLLSSCVQGLGSAAGRDGTQLDPAVDGKR